MPDPTASTAVPKPAPRQGGLPFLVAGLLLVAALAAYAWASVAASRSAAASDAETALLNSSEQLLGALTTIETSQRGFVLTGLDSFLEPYRATLPEVEPALARLRDDWRRTDADTGALERISQRTRDELAYIDRGVRTRREQGFEPAAAIVRSGEGKATMDAFRLALAAVQQRARERVAVAEAADGRSGRIATIAFLLALAVGVALAALAYFRNRDARRTAQLLSRVLDHAPLGLAFVDAGGRLVRANRLFAGTVGHAADAGVDQPFFEAYPELGPKLERPLADVIAGRTGTVEAEALLPRDNGRERVLLFSLFPLSLTKSGEKSIDRGAGLIVSDETDAREAERRIRESEARFRMIADSIPQMAWISEPDGRLVWYNRRWYEFTGTTFEAMQGYGWSQVHHPDHVEAATANFKAALAKGEVWEDTFPLRGADGAYRWFLSQALPIRDDTGRVFRWFGTNTDVTKQRAFEEELAAARDAAEEANVAKSQFLANMSHELRTPLSAVIGYTEMLEEEVEDLGEASLLSDLKKIKNNARHLLSLINDVLDLSKIEADRMEVFAESFPVSETLAEVAATVGSLIEKKNNRLVIEERNALGAMRSDQVKLRQCLMNLLSNAAKFTENGTITLQAERMTRDGADWLSLAVVDDGIGMSLEQTQKLFERFSQADASTTRKFGGTGLGLAITRSFCRLLGGDITVASEEGRGSCFTMLVPAELPRPESEDEPDEAPARTLSGQGDAGLVLVIDDDQSARDLMTRFLIKEGFTVQTAGDGATGLQLARDLMPNIILLDVTMPRMDGWSVLSSLKGDPALADIPVVMVTVIDEHSLGYSLGASEYLLKPVEWERLKTVVERLAVSAEAVVLAVDDDEDALARTAKMLTRAGFNVETAPNGAAGLEKARARRPDLVLLDLQMPVLDGFGFLGEFRSQPEWNDVPVVVLTSKDLTADDWRRLSGRADKVLTKGMVETRDLIAQLRVTLAKNEGAPRGPAAAAPVQPEPVA